MVRKKDFSNELIFLFYIQISVLILLLSAFNLSNHKKNIVQVLGAETNNLYWEELLKKHPTYRDAWIELGRIDKVKQIDPNYFQP